MKKCIVLNCNNGIAKELFNIPSRENIKIAWLKALNVNDFSKSAKVCIKHFHKSDINISVFRTSLRSTAVPVLNLNNFLEAPAPIVNDIEMENLEVCSAENPLDSSLVKKQVLMNNKKSTLLHKLDSKSKTIKNLKKKYKRLSKKCITLKDALQEVQKKVGIESSINEFLQSSADGDYIIFVFILGQGVSRVLSNFI